MDFLTLAKNRYSCRKFTATPVEDNKLNNILQAAIAAPTAKNVQPVKLWVFTSPDALAKIKACTPFSWMKEVPAVIVVGGTTAGAFVRPSDNRNFEDVDAAIVATHIMLAIHAEGLATTWVGYFDTNKLLEAFSEMQGWDLVALFPVGYPADDAAPSDRHNIRKSIHQMVQFL